MRVAPSALLPLVFGTPGELWREASADDRHRLVDLIDILLPTTSRLGGIELDIPTARHPEHVALERSHVRCSRSALRTICSGRPVEHERLPAVWRMVGPSFI